MSYQCLRKFEAKLEQMVEEVIKEGAEQTLDGKWMLPLDVLNGRYGADSACPLELIRAMLAEREEILGIEEDQGVYRIDFQPEFCIYKQRELFDPDRMRTTAVYTLEEADGPHHFYTEHAGGYSLAHRVSKLLEEARRGMSAGISATELMPLLVSDYHFLTEKARLFAPLTEAETQRYLAAGDGKTAFHITLDLEANTVHMENLPDAAECGLPPLTLSLHGRGFTCDNLYKIASGPEACFACEENVEMDMSKLHEKVFRQTILHNLQTFEKLSCELEKLPKQRQDEQTQGGMALA